MSAIARNSFKRATQVSSSIIRQQAGVAVRPFSSARVFNKPAQVTPDGLPDLKNLPRADPGVLKAAIVNPADKYLEHVL